MQVYFHIAHNYKWNNDNYGPIYIPKKGDKIELNEKSIPFYEQIIRRYEHNNFSIADNKYYLNGKEITSYTIKQDYYWMMGDNRQMSLDARSWGYVPFDHVVGKPVFIWLSWDPDAKGFYAKFSNQFVGTECLQPLEVMEHQFLILNFS